MQFPLPFILILTIPSGAGPGDPRVVIGDPAGSIGIFDGSGNLVGLLTSEGPLPNSSPGFFVFDPTDNEDYVGLEVIAGFPGITFSDDDFGVVGRWSEGHSGTPGSTARAFYQIDTPRPSIQSAARLTMTSESDNGAIAPVIDLTASGSAVADARINGESIPRGIWAQFASAGNDAGNPYSADSVTDMAIANVGAAKGGVFAGRTYAIHASFLMQFSVAPAQWNVFLRVNGSNLGRLYRADATDDGLNVNVDRTLYWTPSVDSTTDDIDIFLDEVSGAATVSLLGTADNLLRTLTVTDLGVL